MASHTSDILTSPRVNANGETIRPATKLEAVQEHFQAKGAAFGEKVAFQVADVTGVRSANVRTSTSPQLEPNEAKISGGGGVRVSLTADSVEEEWFAAEERVQNGFGCVAANLVVGLRWETAAGRCCPTSVQ